ncbi:MAG: MaoC/PaaZ C-terminal domain-containing protein [Bacilli bacterium]
MFDRYFEDYQIGDEWTSRGRTITESDIVMFSAFTGDWYPLHTDREWAGKTLFGQRIAHGMLSLSVSTGLMRMEPGVIAAFYGMDKVRFTAPVFIGDTIHVELEVSDKVDKGRAGLLTVHAQIKKQTGEAATVSTMRVLVHKKQGMEDGVHELQGDRH